MDQSILEEFMQSIRSLTCSEERLLDELLKRSNLKMPINWKKEIKATPLSDGGMGSLLLLPKARNYNERMFGAQVSQIEFNDEDGILVSASLNVDKEGALFELDIWKTDFSPLKRIPEEF
jgi:hypothetical protein